tara:strand:- start:1606 stop:1944 length:339 start_codon:yes stop_codon:yes gene_type:complete
MTYIKNISVLTLFVMASMVLSVAAYAMDLQGARDAGAVGERLDGYVAVLQQSSAVDALVKDINQRRHDEYARISQENKQPVAVVAKLAAQQIISRLSKGHFYQSSSGKWVRK